MASQIAGLGNFVALRSILLTAAAVLSIGSAASADPVRIVTGGFADAHEGDNTFVLTGDGFRVSGLAFPSAPLGVCFPCAPGTSIGLSAPAALVDIFGGPATVDGRTFDGINPIEGGPFLEGTFNFTSGSVRVPDLPVDGFAELSLPFVFTGALAGFDNFELSGSPLFSLQLAGSGIATLQFSHPEQIGILASRITFEFQPAAATPEPATILLVGPALAGLALRRRRGLTRS